MSGACLPPPGADTGPVNAQDWAPRALERIQDHTAPVAVVGCGYVGLSVAMGLARAGFPVLGVEPAPKRLAAFQRGENAVPDVEVAEVELDALREAGRMRFTEAVTEDADVYIICVPTPLRDGSPDLSHIEDAGAAVAQRLKRGDMVILESTTYPGTTEELLRPILERLSGLAAGQDFALGNSPERIDPGNRTWHMQNTPKVVGGLTETCTKLAASLYQQMCDTVVPVSSPRAAEITKLLENSYREVNIALVNELAMVCHDFAIDPWEVISAASTKPFGFTPFRPGPGVGGHCIGTDSQYLAWRTKGTAGRQFRLLETSHDVNQRMPAFVAQRTAEILNEHGKAVRGAAVLILGMAYKGGTSDTRESPSIRVAERLIPAGAKIAYHDPHVPEITLDGEVHRSVELSPGFVSWADLVLILTDHPEVDYDRVVHDARCIYDMRGVTIPIAVPEGHRVYRV